MLSSVFVVYTMTSIAKVFFITAGTFGAMAFYGYTTKKDLTSLGKILFMALIGLIIATVVNMFLKSSGFDYILSYAGVAIFVGLTAWESLCRAPVMMNTRASSAIIKPKSKPRLVIKVISRVGLLATP